MTVAGRPPLDLAVNVTDSSGFVTRWGSEDRDPGNVPLGIGFRTQRMDGFADAGLTLRRPIDLEAFDVGLFDDVALVGADGTIAYEGYVTGLPRSMGDQHELTVQAAGWMSHMRDRTFREIYVDRDLGRWKAAAILRINNLITGNYMAPVGPDVSFDSATSTQTLTLRHAEEWTAPVRPTSEAWYDSAEIGIGSVYYDAVNGGKGNTAVADWDLLVRTTDTEDATAVVGSSGDIWTLLPEAGTVTDTAGSRFAFLSYSYSAGSGGAPGTEYRAHFRNLAVYGTHGLTKRGTAPSGFYASDVLKNLVARFAPKLNTQGVTDTTYPIPHLVWLDPTTPYDAALTLNAFHLWDMGVWENRTLHYAPADLTDYDWEVRQDDPGVTLTLQGQDTDQLANGITVQFSNVATGTDEWLTPDTHPELTDDSIDNPANSHDRSKWTSKQIPFPTTTDAALQIGRAALAEFNQPRTPGTITVRNHIRDRAGHWQPVWKVRAGDRIAITSSTTYSDRPRLIQETSYSHDDHSLQVSVDNTQRVLEGYFDRVSTALTAANL